MKRVMKKKKGFTLMELLIVIAIIVVLVAITIPVMSGQTTKAKETADLANLRSCYGEYQDKIITEGVSIEDAVDAMLAVKINYDGTNGTTNKRSSTENSVTYTATKVDGQTWTFYE